MRPTPRGVRQLRTWLVHASTSSERFPSTMLSNGSIRRGIAGRGRALGLGSECCEREVLSLGEDHEGVGGDPVLLHLFGRRFGLHELSKRGKVGISQITPTSFEPWVSLNARIVIPRGPNTSSRLGELSQWSTSSTSWNAR